ncbi:MAG: YlmC/YmxH family sporulation protein [Oscillospiraceae bacterium]|nr:YlmC/YmxH family sporulation protein [Oscillospiraceae bacterium]
MKCKLVDLRCKEVINIHNGFRLGFVCDVIIDVLTGHMAAILVPGPCRFFGVFGREDDYLIPWECIRKIGDDIILVNVEDAFKREKRKKIGWL